MQGEWRNRSAILRLHMRGKQSPVKQRILKFLVDDRSAVAAQADNAWPGQKDPAFRDRRTRRRRRCWSRDFSGNTRRTASVASS
jgi:hypothetical protein